MDSSHIQNAGHQSAKKLDRKLDFFWNPGLKHLKVNN